MPIHTSSHKKETIRNQCFMNLLNTNFINICSSIQLQLNRDGYSPISEQQFLLLWHILYLLLLEVPSWSLEFQQWIHIQSSSFTTFRKSSFVHTWPSKLFWSVIEMDTVFGAMLTIVMIQLWQTFYGYSMVSKRYVIVICNAICHGLYILWMKIIWTHT